MTISEAKKITRYVVTSRRESGCMSKDIFIVSTRYYDYVMDCAFQASDYAKVLIHQVSLRKFDIYRNQRNSSQPEVLGTFASLSRAEQEVFDHARYEVESDDVLMGRLYETAEEAEDELLTSYMDRHFIDEPEARQMLQADRAAYEQQVASAAAHQAAWEAGRPARRAAAEAYAVSVEHVPGEGRAETAHRLRQALGREIDSDTFWQAVRLIREKK